MIVLKVGSQWYLVESVEDGKLGNKDYGKKDKSGLKQVITTYAKAFDPTRNKRAYNRAKRAYDREKRAFRDKMDAHLTAFLAGEITDTQFSYRVKKDMTDMYNRAFQLGHAASGMDFLEPDDADKKFIDKFRKTEFQYLNKFIDDMKNGRGAMDYRTRMDMYINTIDAMFDAGRVDAYPDEGTKIYWILGAAEHCPDCVELSNRSPFTPKTLPTTPRAGHTRCLSRCKCSLRIRYEQPSNLNLTFTTVSRNKAKELGAESYDWNLIDDIKTTQYMIESKHMIYGERFAEHLKLIEENRKRIYELPEDLEPDTIEFDILHCIGDWILSETMKV